MGKPGVDDMSPHAIRAFLDMEAGGEREVEWYDNSIVTEYFNEFSTIAKSFRVIGGMSEAFKEYAGFLHTLDVAATKLLRGDKGPGQYHYRRMEEQDPRLGRNQVGGLDPGGHSDPQNLQPRPRILVGDVISATAGKGVAQESAYEPGFHQGEGAGGA
jgi:hypothetical protein